MPVELISAESTQLFTGPPDEPHQIVRVSYAGCTESTQVGVGGESRAEHLDVPYGTELAAEPAQLGAQVLRPVGLHEPAQRPEIGAEAARRDARLVHGFGISGRPDCRLVCVEAGDRGRERGANYFGNAGSVRGHGQASTLRAFVRAIARSCSITWASMSPTTVSTDSGEPASTRTR